MSRALNAPEERDRHPVEQGQPFRADWIYHGPYSSSLFADIPAKGGLGPHIHHEHDEVVVILEGEADFRLGDAVLQVGPGDVIHVSAGTVHAPIDSRDGCLLVSIFSGPFDPDKPDRDFVDD